MQYENIEDDEDLGFDDDLNFIETVMFIVFTVIYNVFILPFCFIVSGLKAGYHSLRKWAFEDDHTD